MKTLLGILMLVLFVGAIYALNEATRTQEGKSILHVAKELEVQVETQRPVQREIIRTVQAPGEVEPFAEVEIRSEVVGRIVELPIEEGDRVEKGALLCRLDDADYRARLLSAEANVAKLQAMITQADAEWQKARRDLERQVRLSERDATSPIELADTRTLLVGAEAILEMRRQELIEAKAALQSAQEDLDRTVINSPIAGVVSQLFAEEGEVVITGTMNNPGTQIMVVSDLSVMQVRCRVDETDAPLVAADQSARIYLQSDTHLSIPGEVLRVATKGTKPVGRDVVTFETLVLITGEDPRVKPGMTANVEIEVARKQDALTVPVQAVVYRKRRDLPERLSAELERTQENSNGVRESHATYAKLIFCVQDGKAVPHLVETGINDANAVEIVEGLAAGETVVTGPYRSLDQLQDGSPVKLEEPPTEKLADKSQAASEEGDAVAGEDAPEQTQARADNE